MAAAKGALAPQRTGRKPKRIPDPAYPTLDSASGVWGFDTKPNGNRITADASGVYGIDTAPSTDGLHVASLSNGLTMIY